MMNKATEFLTEIIDVASLMTALDNKNIPSEQDWEKEQTTWYFDDGSTIQVTSGDVEIK